MSDLRTLIAEYLLVRRSLGYKLKWDGLLLADFADFCEREGATTVTTDIALAWAKTPVGCSSSWWANRLTVVRVFARYLQAIDPSAQVPPVGLIRDRNRRATPFLYSDGDIASLMAAADGLSNPLVAITFKTLIGLLSVTGLRVGEAIRLDRADVCWEQGLLRINRSKYNKMREVPLHASCVERLRAYSGRRDLECATPNSASFFVSELGHRLHYPRVQQTFATLVNKVGLEPRSDRCRPRSPRLSRHPRYADISSQAISLDAQKIGIILAISAQRSRALSARIPPSDDLVGENNAAHSGETVAIGRGCIWRKNG